MPQDRGFRFTDWKVSFNFMKLFNVWWKGLWNCWVPNSLVASVVLVYVSVYSLVQGYARKHLHCFAFSPYSIEKHSVSSSIVKGEDQKDISSLSWPFPIYRILRKASYIFTGFSCVISGNYISDSVSEGWRRETSGNPPCLVIPKSSFTDLWGLIVTLDGVYDISHNILRRLRCLSDKWC